MGRWRVSTLRQAVVCALSNFYRTFKLEGCARSYKRVQNSQVVAIRRRYIVCTGMCKGASQAGGVCLFGDARQTFHLRRTILSSCIVCFFKLLLINGCGPGETERGLTWHGSDGARQPPSARPPGAAVAQSCLTRAMSPSGIGQSGKWGYGPRCIAVSTRSGTVSLGAHGTL